MKRSLILLPCLLTSVALAQQGNNARTSSLTRLSLTPGATRVTDPAATREFGQVLNALAKQQNGGCQASEYLVWDAELAEQVSADLAVGFKARSMTFKLLEEDEDEESSSLSFLLTEKTNRYVGLLYADAESVVLGWCQLKASVSVKPATPAPVRPAAPAPAKSAAVQAPAPSAPPVRL
ncbi:hypothetical protein ACFSC4_21010 [Deinococcus malanensis]|uniref:hypothetical protein n=1 Tax=Deinococcus malanensis TaxID=1706855 RepID=UPI00362A0AA1